MGYLICRNCGGYYKLQPRESPEDFSECQYSGKLIYTDRLDFKTDDKGKLPSITSMHLKTKIIVILMNPSLPVCLKP